MRNIRNLGKLLSRRSPARRSNARRQRSLQVEALERRLVLSGLPELAIDAPVTEQPDVPITPSEIASNAPIVQAIDGTIQVQADQTVVVRQFMDYRLQAVVEVELAEQWYSFPAELVTQVQVQTPLGEQGVFVDPAVDKPVRIIDGQSADQVFGGDVMEVIDNVGVEEELVPISLPSQAPPLTTLAVPEPTIAAEPGAEGEDPVPGDPPLAAPEIVEFYADSQRGFWSFRGNVIDDQDVNGLVVKFSGVNGLLDGKTAVVDQFGMFEVTIQIPAGTQGVAVAQTTDRDGMESNIAEELVY